MPPIKTFAIPVGTTVIAIAAAFLIGGVEVGLIVGLLAILEISISFDNAIVNAHVLQRMTPKWQGIFLTWGILIAVFGMRLIFPIVIVAAAAGLPLPDVVDLALNEPGEYAHKLEESNAIIAAFGGVFLLMVFLDFFFDDEKDSHWVGPAEAAMAKLGSISNIGTTLGAGTLLLVSQVMPAKHETDILVAGIAGLLCYLLSKGVADSLEPDDHDEEEYEANINMAVHKAQADPNGPSVGEARAAAIAAMAKGGFASFMYLELLDASFSFDGVIGAFAISKDIIVIAVGLGLGALYIRTLTVYLVRQGTLSEYRYLEHGAHWAIGVLAGILFIGIEEHPPEVVTGSLGAGLILLSFYFSVRANNQDDAAGILRGDALHEANAAAHAEAESTKSLS